MIQIQIKTAVVLAFPSRWGEPASGPRQRGCWGLSADRLSGRISKADLQRPSSGFEDVNLSKVPHLEQDHVQIVGRPDNGVSDLLEPMPLTVGDEEVYRTASTPPSLKQIAGYRALARNEVRRTLHD